MKPPVVTYWRDKPVSDLSREELVEAVEWLGAELTKSRERIEILYARFGLMARAMGETL